MEDLYWYFPLLLRITHHVSIRHCIETMSPEEIDKLGQEIALVFQQCSRSPESKVNNDDECVAFHEDMIKSVITPIFCMCFSDSKNGRRDNDWHNQLQKAIITPANIQALFCMCDPNNIRNGERSIQCHALTILRFIRGITSTYHLRVPITAGASANSEATTTTASFGQILISTMANTLMPQNNLGDATAPWEILYEALVTSHDNKEPSDTVSLLESLVLIDWPVILQQDKVYIVKDPRGNVYYDSLIFVNLHRLVCKVLVDDSENMVAKTFLREKMGTCHKLLQIVLRRIISEEIFAPEPSRHTSRLNEIEIQVGAFLGRFMNCLVPPSVQLPVDDRETMTLLRQTRRVLMEHIVQAMSTQNHLHMPKNTNTRRQVLRLQKIVSVMDQWTCRLDHQSDQGQWKRFQEAFLTENVASLTSIKTQVVVNHLNERKTPIKPLIVNVQEGRHDQLKKKHKKQCAMVFDPTTFNDSTSPPPWTPLLSSSRPKSNDSLIFLTARRDSDLPLQKEKTPHVETSCELYQHTKKKRLILLALFSFITSVVVPIGSFIYQERSFVAKWCILSLEFLYPSVLKLPPGNVTATTTACTSTCGGPQLQMI